MTKKQRVEELLLRDGSVSNIEIVYGTHGVRSTRLSDLIMKLRNMGYKIETKEVRGAKGEYIDCIYKLIELPPKLPQ